MNADTAVATLPDFDLLANFLIEEGVLTLSPSELHGLIAGQLAAGARYDEDTLVKVIADLTGAELQGRDTARKGLADLYATTLAQLEGDDFSVQLLVPEDEQALSQRVDALGEWCSGFLSGFGLCVSAQSLSEQAQEGLKDIAEIAQIALESAEEETEEDENSLIEVYEYVRMAFMLLFSEFNSVEPPTQAAQSPVLH
ncbi:UPF0149 family protein [Nitrincola tapanii]|uniref:UPF0149 family protein n=1 Tax=Nitrincola tapanii TaxID=1708751 RepID=A0A5A9W9V9_9GAMM|nr:UPF0149 family protein [Nitrincola tapanii]KAA0876211.1 UPF0149 family protein [Nitrincola tapanii]